MQSFWEFCPCVSRFPYLRDGSMGNALSQRSHKIVVVVGSTTVLPDDNYCQNNLIERQLPPLLQFGKYSILNHSMGQ